MSKSADWYKSLGSTEKRNLLSRRAIWYKSLDTAQKQKRAEWFNSLNSTQKHTGAQWYKSMKSSLVHSPGPSNFSRAWASSHGKPEDGGYSDPQG